MTRRGILLIALITSHAFTAMAQSTSGGSQMLTLDEAIDLALNNNRSAKNARLETERSDDNLAALKTHRLPSIKVSGFINQPLSTFDTTFDKGVFGTYPGIGPVPSETTAIKSSTNTTALFVTQITQPLTQLKRISLQIKQQQLAREISDAERQAKEQSVVADVKKAYYAILQTQAVVASAEEGVKLYRLR